MNEPIWILFASQTGTAEDVAHRIARQARRRHYRARVSAIDDLPLTEILEQEVIIFVTATTGQGEEPTNMKRFWQFLLRADLPIDLMDHLTYTVFGLGDSSYPKYNWPAKKLDRRLEDLGAITFHPKGEADDQDYLGVDTVLDRWLEDLWPALATVIPSSDKDIIPDYLRPPPRLKITFANEVTNGHAHEQIPLDATWCTLTRNERATASDHFQDTRYFELTADQNLDYGLGDVACLWPQNAPEDVDKFLKLMNWPDVDRPFHLEASSDDWPLPKTWPAHTTIRQLIKNHLDVFSVPRRSFFEMLALFTTNETETDKLREFCSSEGQEDLWDYANRPKRTIYEVLTEFKSAKIPLEYIADVFPEMRARQFSIASSCALDQRKIDLLVAVVAYKTNLSKPRTGVCTAWMSRLQVGDRIPVRVAKGTMTPPSLDTPVILIGPGTGIAPFRAYAQARREQSDTMVFFGCRSQENDFYYKDEWSSLQKSRSVQFVLAASRDQDDKIYVQHRMREKGAEIWEALEDGASIYLSGSANKMPDAVRKALKEIIQVHGGKTEKEAALYLDILETSRRFQEETWS